MQGGEGGGTLLLSFLARTNHNVSDYAAWCFDVFFFYFLFSCLTFSRPFLLLLPPLALHGRVRLLLLYVVVVIFHTVGAARALLVLAQ